MSNKVYVGNLNYKADNEQLREYFSEFGEIQDVALPTDKHTGRPRGFGFVTFSTDDQAQQACKADGQEFLGRTLKVNIAKEQRGGGGGGGGGHRDQGY